MEDEGRESSSEPELLAASIKDALLESDMVSLEGEPVFQRSQNGTMNLAIVRTWI